ncbi:hypothetical protein [Legionella longbeachae]|uniref:Uncharacterized protein n=1 Tax=Legionella longbeachae serogroup 1 (strain NSW150) TaxID=661367 RepID=D3HME1_LEGLN|nr:hypothetical protein [Legionella longbeachae]VEE04052.1 Uncharacterised protein [Legionella oakridgensis]ARB93099.1 hypothetical protein A6J40_13350 [Legionella longbeachae]ARM33840.1 hypothetical protein B0B39_10000 [Legionella longbeachae]EEZ96983.1 hypothetical protein LLB_2184 [Legionella longbeachae D-4968]QEY52889.1 hypothetical protein FQU71_17580 [Legionella longbeachae]
MTSSTKASLLHRTTKVVRQHLLNGVNSLGSLLEPNTYDRDVLQILKQMAGDRWWATWGYT